MHAHVELSSLDLRYEGHRLRDDAREARLLASIAERGIEEPLCGVDTPAARLLLDGFKRCRSAKKLSIACVPYVSLGVEEATGIVQLMRASTAKGLGILEQARFVGDLVTIHGLSVAEVAQTLSRSKGWVSMRRRLLDEMSPAIQELLFRGSVSGVRLHVHVAAVHAHERGRPGPELERFVQAVAGQRLSVRDIELLAQAYFRGPASLRDGDRGRPAGLVARTIETRAGGSGRLHRVRARAAEGPGTAAEVHPAGAGQVPGPAAEQPGLLRPSPAC